MKHKTEYKAFLADVNPIRNYHSLNVSEESLDRKGEVFKRVFDVIISIVSLVILLPFIAILAILIWLHDGGSPIYRQRRIGKYGKEFYCLKFRSMIVTSAEVLDELLKTDPAAAAEWEKDQKLKNDPRITKVGRFIRKTSLDELPQLWNILRGDMSLVGPRPIVKDEMRKYGADFAYYSSVKPGVTGLWQVSGRNEVAYEERVQLDVRYVKSASFWGDIKIILLTVPAVLGSNGAY